MSISNYGVFGETALTGAAIVLSVGVLIAFLAGTSPQMGTAARAASPPVEQAAAMAPVHVKKLS